MRKTCQLFSLEFTGKNMETLLEAKAVTKHFPGVLALDRVDFELRQGEVHALLGENGAGKSTLVKIITGAYTKDSGDIIIDGKSVHFHSPADAEDAGIGIIYQEFSQVNTLSVAENIYLGRYPKKHGLVDWDTMHKDARELLERFNVNAHPQDILSTLCVATRQMVEILKAIHKQGIKVLIMDEPTSALSDAETELLFDFIRNLKDQNVSVIYISHRLDEIKKISDRITIIRNGQNVITADADTMDINDIVSNMVGRDLKNHYPEKPDKVGNTLLEVENLTGQGFSGITFTAKKGEILGITGLLGAGKTEVLQAIYGGTSDHTGTIRINGEKVSITSPRHANKHRIGLIPESRREQGLILTLSNLFNISLASLKKLSAPFLRLKDEIQEGKEQIKNLEVRPDDPFKQVRNLSGGNQQKIVLAKWLMRDCDILFFDEPTRGIDVGAKFQIYSLMSQLAQAGKCVVISSSEVEEIVGTCSRVLVMKDGELIHEFVGSEINNETIVGSMSGGIVH
jgi:ribose transport system ATP-binding protein